MSAPKRAPRVKKVKTPEEIKKELIARKAECEQEKIDIESDGNLVKPYLPQLNIIPEMLEDALEEVEEELAGIIDHIAELEKTPQI